MRHSVNVGKIKFVFGSVAVLSAALFSSCSGGFSADSGSQFFASSASSAPGASSSGGSTGGSSGSTTSASTGSTGTPSSGTMLGPTPTINTRNYLMGIFTDYDDSATTNALGYQFDYTENGSYQGDCLSCAWSGTTNAPMIIDLHHIETSYSDFNAAATGGYNSGYTAVVQSLVPYAKYIYAVRIDSEFNGAWSQWSPWYNNYNYDNGVSPATWIAGFRNYAMIVRQYLPNAKIIWNTNSGQGNPMAYYPGDDVIDIMGIDAYTFYQYYPDSTSASNDQLGGGWGSAIALSAFAKQHGKPMGFPEWGDTFGDGVFIAAMGKFVNDPTNNVAFHTFWDSAEEVTGSDRLSDHPANEAAYIQAFGGRKYTGTFLKLPNQ